MAEQFNGIDVAGKSNGTDISYRSTQHLQKRLLERAQAEMVFERFGRVSAIPKNSTKTTQWRRYESLKPLTTPIDEGVTPEGQALTYTNIQATLQQYGGVLKLTDVIHDTHEDPVLMEMADLAAEQAADTVEYLRYSVLRAGTNVIYGSGGSSRVTAGVLAKTDLQLAYRTLKRFRAPFISQVISASANVGTEPVGRAYYAVGHTDLDADIRKLSGFVPIEKYGSAAMKPLPDEIGKVDNMRFILTTYAEPFLVGGNATPTGLVADDLAANTPAAAVYPLIIFSRNAYGIVPLQGKDKVKLNVFAPKATKEDPLGQRGNVGWVTWNATAILNETFMLRIECTASDLGAADPFYTDYYTQSVTEAVTETEANAPIV